MPYIKINTGQIFFEIYGAHLSFSGEKANEKPTIVVVHGGSGQLDHTYEILFWEQAADFAQVIFLDNTGLGRSTCEKNRTWSLENWAHDLYEFCNKLGLKKPFIAGDSIGGHIAMQFGILYPDFANGLILMDTEAKCDREEIVMAFAKKSSQAANVARACLYEPTHEAVEQYMKVCLPLCTQNSIPEKMYQFSSSVNEECLSFYNKHVLYHFDLIDDLSKIKDPVLYLVSEDNPFHNTNSARKTAQAFDQKVLNCNFFKNSGLIQVDAPHKGMEIIKSFVINIAPSV